MRYAAQAFWGPGLKPGEPMPFVCAVDAEDGAQILARSAAGAIAFQQLVDPEGPIFDEPEVLGVWGRVPAGAISIDDDGQEPWHLGAA